MRQGLLLSAQVQEEQTWRQDRLSHSLIHLLMNVHHARPWWPLLGEQHNKEGPAVSPRSPQALRGIDKQTSGQAGTESLAKRGGDSQRAPEPRSRH